MFRPDFRNFRSIFGPISLFRASFDIKNELGRSKTFRLHPSKLDFELPELILGGCPGIAPECFPECPSPYGSGNKLRNTSGGLCPPHPLQRAQGPGPGPILRACPEIGISTTDKEKYRNCKIHELVGTPISIWEHGDISFTADPIFITKSSTT